MAIGGSTVQVLDMHGVSHAYMVNTPTGDAADLLFMRFCRVLGKPVSVVIANAGEGAVKAIMAMDRSVLSEANAAQKVLTNMIGSALGEVAVMLSDRARFAEVSEAVTGVLGNPEWPALKRDLLALAVRDNLPLADAGVYTAAFARDPWEPTLGAMAVARELGFFGAFGTSPAKPAPK